MADINKIAEELGTLTILEAADLVKLLEEKWGVSAAAPVAAAGAAAAPAEAEEEKTEFNVVLTEAGANKIAVIKVTSTLAPASSSLALAALASSLETASRMTAGVPSTSFLASTRPRPAFTSRTALITASSSSHPA